MSGGREPGHVGAGFGDDHVCDLLPNPGNGFQQVDLAGPGPTRLDDVLVKLSQRLFHQVAAPQDGAGQLGVMAVEVPGQCLLQLGDLAPHATGRQGRQTDWVLLSGDHRGQHRPRGHGLQIRRERGQLDRGILQHQLQPGDLLGTITHQLDPASGQHLQPANLRRRHERRPQQPLL
jgi:hypothetical protein